MKILSIRIKNLASLEGVTEIDFTQEPLSSAGIFAITGPTGAGKSTILDALCLALYGKTPRYLQARESGIEISDVQGSVISQGDVRGILRDGTGEGFAEVDFVGVDGQLYRVTWRVRRARDRADGSLQAFSVALKNINTNTDISGRKTELQDEIERLVGLNFEQFTRSVLLAQGDFTAFLKAARDEKSALLEKLTGTHIYSEISKQAYEHYKKEERELENLNLQREGIPTLTIKEQGALEEQKAATEKIIYTQEKEVEALSREIAWHAQLSILQSSFAIAHAAHEQANEAKQNAMVRELELKKAERVQSVRIWIDSEQAAKNQVAEKTITLQQLQKALYNLQEGKDSLDLLLQKAYDDVTAKAKEQEEAKALLEEARGLDIQIREKTEQVNQAANEVKDADQNYKQQEKQLHHRQQQADQLLSNIEKSNQWKEENSNRQPIFENQNLIISKLSDAKKLLNSLQSLLPQLQVTQSTIDGTKQGRIDLETQSSFFRQTLLAEQELASIVSLALSAIPITTLESEKAVIDLAVGDIVAAEAHWKIMLNNQIDLGALKEKLSNNKAESESKTLLLAQTVKQFVIVKAERDTSARMLDKARLAAAENVEFLRAQLVSGDPCPVCGNKEHPYAAQNPQLDCVLQTLETAHQHHEKKYTDCLAAEISLRETGNQLKEIIAVQEHEVGTKETVLQYHKEAWERFTIHHDAETAPDDQKAIWLAQQLQDKKTKQKDLQDRIQSYAAKKRELDTLQNNVNHLDKQLNENTNAVKDAERSLQSLQEQVTQYKNDQLKNNNLLSEIEQGLSGYFAAQDWFGNWKNNPIIFLQAISDFAEKWKSNTQKLQEDTQQHGVLSATLKAMKEQLESLLAEVQKKQTAFAGLKEQQDFLAQKRKYIFNGEAAATIESRLKRAVAIVQLVFEKGKIDWDKVQTDITRIGVQKEQSEKDIEFSQQQAEAFAEKIQQWLITFNSRHNLTLDTDKLLQLLTLSAEWIETERADLRAIDDAITKALSVLLERTSQLEQHNQQRLSERNEEELNELLNTAKISLQQRVQEKNESSFQLQQDSANKQKIGGLLGIIEAKALIVENWAKLNEIIGSADGKKFRQIAQEYTLDVLLSYANVHLEMLSKRYLLQRISNTLGLQVLDLDMGDEVRTVYSLSGGESFLVSLALALGLASLSSSSMLVESLFIDEGFGSLDPTTLNIAMDALERLQNQGRKVGVISHVQEMTERIPVQIKVSKRNNGRSMVEVMATI